MPSYYVTRDQLSALSASLTFAEQRQSPSTDNWTPGLCGRLRLTILAAVRLCGRFSGTACGLLTICAGTFSNAPPARHGSGRCASHQSAGRLRRAAAIGQFSGLVPPGAPSAWSDSRFSDRVRHCSLVAINGAAANLDDIMPDVSRWRYFIIHPRASVLASSCDASYDAVRGTVRLARTSSLPLLATVPRCGESRLFRTVPL